MGMGGTLQALTRIVGWHGWSVTFTQPPTIFLVATWVFGSLRRDDYLHLILCSGDEAGPIAQGIEERFK